MTQSNFANFCSYIIKFIHIKVTFYDKGSCKCILSQGNASLSPTRHHGQVQKAGSRWASKFRCYSSVRKQGGEPREDCKLRLRSLRARSRPLALCQTLTCSLGRSSRPCTHGFFTARSDVRSGEGLCSALGVEACQELLSRECWDPGTQTPRAIGVRQSRVVATNTWAPGVCKRSLPEDPGAPEPRSGAEGGREDGAHGRASQRELRDGARQHRLWRTLRARRSIWADACSSGCSSRTSKGACPHRHRPGPCIGCFPSGPWGWWVWARESYKSRGFSHPFHLVPLGVGNPAGCPSYRAWGLSL